jgi:hypothetical protein
MKALIVCLIAACTVACGSSQSQCKTGAEGKAEKGVKTGVAGAKAGVKTGVEGVKTFGSSVGGLFSDGKEGAKKNWKKGKENTRQTAKEGADDVDQKASECP